MAEAKIERWALILGASSGIGEASARHAAAAGYNICGVYLGRSRGEKLDAAIAAVKATGLDAVRPREDFAKAIETISREGRTIYTPFRAEVLGCASSSDAVALARATKDDPWDGRPSREEVFIQKLKAL